MVSSSSSSTNYNSPLLTINFAKDILDYYGLYADGSYTLCRHVLVIVLKIITFKRVIYNYRLYYSVKKRFVI